MSSFAKNSVNTLMGAAGVTSAAIAIPNNASGRRARKVYLACDGNCQFLPALDTTGSGPINTVDGATVVAVGTGILLVAENPIEVDTGAFSHFYFLGIAGGEIVYMAGLEV